ncbi:TadE family protein [Botrimarina hoheduenensis]|uniref:TadE-like protein n=1 Tax=Botrimarina hoheduenensis TaxID=2528000 RepID=A0A5C5WCP3_9BACT|nr:TadE family protein [Botrimarina hoheduenensis]TWT48676.1 TadE-like protein [Botrimarina hoheduenensis]
MFTPLKIAAARRRSMRRGRMGQRRGAEIVELAFALPIMSIIIFGTLELCEVIFVKQSLAVATYEAGRMAGRPGTNSTMVRDRFENIMNDRRVSGATLTIDPPEVAGATVGQVIRITGAAPVSGNSSSNMVLTGVPDIVEEVVFVRE